MHLLQSKAPEWKPEYAEKAAEGLEGRGGFVKTKTDHAPLLTEPLSSILSRARELSGRKEDFLVGDDPFAGLAAEQPVRALSALTRAAKSGEFPEWAWRRFLNSELSVKNDKLRFVFLIAERLAGYSEEVITTLIRPVQHTN